MRRSSWSTVVFGVLAVAVGCRTQPSISSTSSEHALPALPPVSPGELRPGAAFATIEDDDQRAQALFVEVSRVLLRVA